MAGSWGTKVEAAFNQSPLLAGCPEEPAEERLGGGGARGEHWRGGGGCGREAPSNKLGQPQDPTTSPYERHSERTERPDPARAALTLRLPKSTPKPSTLSS